MLFAESEFELNELQGDGQTLRSHLESVERQTGKRLAQLNQPNLPEYMKHMWNWFQDLCGSRQVGMALNPLSYTEIAAWDNLNGHGITPRELQIIRALDNMFLVHHQAKKGK